MVWPQSLGRLASEQDRLAAEIWTAWRPLGRYTVGAVYVCFDQTGPGNGSRGDRGFAAAACGNEYFAPKYVGGSALHIPAANL